MKFNGVYELCGHKETVDVVGGKSAEKKAEWYFSGLCPECYKKKKRRRTRAKECFSAKEAEEVTITPDVTRKDGVARIRLDSEKKVSASG